MLKIFFYALLYYCLTVQTAHPVVEIAFTPSKVCEEKIIELINNSQSSIDVAVYSINNQQIIDALYRARQRDVSIRILTDKLQASGKYSKVEEMYSNGLNIRVHTKNKIEHNKFAVFDEKSASTGSFNWTNAVTSKNSENCLFLINEPDYAKIYQQRFEELWEMNTETKSEQWFEKRRIRNEHNN